jgi:hypothetical protein
MGLKGFHIKYWKGEKIVHLRPGKNRRRPFLLSLSELHQEVLRLIDCWHKGLLIHATEHRAQEKHPIYGPVEAFPPHVPSCKRRDEFISGLN